MAAFAAAWVGPAGAISTSGRGITAGDPVPAQVGTIQEAPRRRMPRRCLAQHRFLGTAQDHAANQGVEPRPGHKRRVGRVDREHGDPAPAHPPLDRQHVRAALAQRDRRRARPRAQPRDKDRPVLGGWIGTG